MTRTMRVLALGAVMGCNSSSAVTEPARPKTIQAVTIDGTSNLGPSPVIRFAGQYAGGGLPADARDTILAGSSLATWPDRAPVTADVSLTAATSPSSSDLFTIASRAPLSDGWYIGLAGGVPQDVSWTDPLGHHVEGDGAIGVRVHVGSAPRLLRLDFCYKGADTTAVAARFSEPVVPLSADDAFPVWVTAASGSCVALSLPTTSSPLTDIEFVCDAAAFADSFVVAVGDGLASPPGVAVPAFRTAITPTSLPSFDATGCNSYKPEF